MNNTKLTVIIPFLNEGEEVENTIESIVNTSSDKLDIILINDASDDGYNYENLLKRYNVLYIENEQRKGVSNCRNIGVKHCNTPYFLFLDAHMRFYDSNWVESIVSFLNENEKVLVCCQTKELRLDVNGSIVANDDRPTSYGAYVDLYNRFNLFEPIWIFDNIESFNDNIIDIPCVLGAGYAMSKIFWELLLGLEGLNQYGNDEAYLSIKVWLQGGRCVLLKDTVIGHLYRDKPPYKVDLKYRIFNRYFLAEVLLPFPKKKRIHSLLKYTCKEELYSFVLLLAHKKSKEIKEMRNYYDKIFINDFHQFEKVNNLRLNEINKESDIRYQINQIAYQIITDFHKITNLGLLSGQMGLVIFLFHYAKYTNNQSIDDLASIYLDRIFERIDASTSIDFHSGLCGIGWGLEYLVQNKMININTDEILEEVDKKVNCINLDRIDDYNLDHGLGGIIHYIIARSQSKIDNNQKNIDIESFFRNSMFLLDQGIVNSDSLDVYLRFTRLFDDTDTDIDGFNLSIYDLLYLPDKVDTLNSERLGLDGIAGFGLNLMWNKYMLFQ